MLTTWGNPEWSQQIMLVFTYAMFMVGYPHIAYSYVLFYKDFYSYLRNPESEFTNKARLFVAGILAPVLIICFYAYVGITHNGYLFGYGLSTYLFLIGWHYVKQGYGVLITTSVYKRIFYSNWQKRILYGNAYIVWIYAWVRLNGSTIINNISFYDIPINVPHFPMWCQDFLLAAVCISSLLAIGTIFYVWRVEKKGIAFNGLVGYISACYIWRILICLNPVFTFCILAFHGLQYLPFVYKFKKNELESEKDAPSQNFLKENSAKITLLEIFIFIAPAATQLLFSTLPTYLDKLHGPWSGVSNYFFLIAVSMFINIHHFFIDHAFWRKDNAKIQKFIFNS